MRKSDLKEMIRQGIIQELTAYHDSETFEDEDLFALEEAKKKKDEETEDVESEDVSIEDIPTTDEMPADDEMPAEDTSTDTGLESVAANLEGTESEVMAHLMSALKIAKGMNNEKLTTQIGNTLKFFVSEYIGGGE